MNADFVFFYLKKIISNLSKTDIGLDNVDNTSDIMKPVSTNQAQQLKPMDINQKYIDHIHGLLRTGQNIRVAIIGDSTSSGMGDRDSIYAELGDKNSPEGIENLVLNMIFSSPYLLPFDEVIMPSIPAGKTETIGTFIWDALQLKLVTSPNIRYTYFHKKTKRDKLTIIYLKRYSTSAPTFDVVCGGITTTVDTYKSPQDFGSITGQTQTGWDFATQEITIPTDGNTFSFTINNLLNTHASGGTAIIIGFYYGEAVDFRNYSVSSMTLLNNSTANQSRGVTTTGQLQKAYAFGANIFFIGLATNDSKTGVSTIDAYKNDLLTRINEIKAYDDQSVIIMFSAPSGETGSIYENNTEYFLAMKEVAEENDCGFFDIERLINTFYRSDVVINGVHPNRLGYDSIGESITNVFNFSNIDYMNKLSLVSSQTQLYGSPSFLSYLEYDILTKLVSIITPSTFVKILFFDEISGTSLLNRTSISGNATVNADVSTLSPGTSGFLRSLTFNGEYYEISDINNLSFTTGSNDLPFSIIWAGKFSTNDYIDAYFCAKRDVAPVSALEWQMICRTDQGVGLVLYKGDGTAYIGRNISTAPPTYQNLTEIVTYAGNSLVSGIKIYQNGVAADNTNYSSGSYTYMSNTVAAVRNGRMNNGVIERPLKGTQYFLAIVSGELTSGQVLLVHRLLMSALNNSGVSVI